jgi:hypothetical protein
LNPADLRDAYKLTSTGSAMVAIVHAYDDPTAEPDVAVHRSQFGLPACTIANGCFRKVNQIGGTSYNRQSASSVVGRTRNVVSDWLNSRAIACCVARSRSSASCHWTGGIDRPARPR